MIDKMLMLLRGNTQNLDLRPDCSHLLGVATASVIQASEGLHAKYCCYLGETDRTGLTCGQRISGMVPQGESQAREASIARRPFFIIGQAVLGDYR